MREPAAVERSARREATDQLSKYCFMNSIVA